MTNLSSQDLAKYSATEVASLADVDVYAVRAEGERRQAAAQKRIASLCKQIAKEEANLTGSHIIMKAAFAELSK
jgi:hypothetical protein